MGVTLQAFDIPTMQTPCLINVQMGGEDHSSKVHDFGSYGEVVIAEDSVRERYVCSMSRFDSFVMVYLTGDIIRDDAANVGKFIDYFYRLSVDADTDTDVPCCLSGGRLDKDLRLFYIELHFEASSGLISLTISGSE